MDIQSRLIQCPIFSFPTQVSPSEDSDQPVPVTSLPSQSSTIPYVYNSMPVSQIPYSMGRQQQEEMYTAVDPMTFSETYMG